jgi:hypothetical protein
MGFKLLVAACLLHTAGIILQLLIQKYPVDKCLGVAAVVCFLSRPESPAPGLVQQAGTPGYYGEMMPLSSTFFSPTGISLRNSIG